MAVTASHRLPREWLHLILALLVTAGIGAGWYWAAGGVSRDELDKYTPERLRRLLLGVEQILCYFAFVWAGLILMNRSLEVSRQRRAFRFDLLPAEEGTRILPEDARPYARKIDQVSGGQPFVLTTMLRAALTKFAITRSAADVAEVVRTQADVEQGRMATSMGTVNYLVWAIPAVGFLGTVRGLAGGMSMAGVDEENLQKFLKAATDQLGTAFDCTFIALFLSVILMYMLLSVQKKEEMLIIDSQSYCQDRLLLRLYDPKPEASAAVSGFAPVRGV